MTAVRIDVTAEDNALAATPLAPLAVALAPIPLAAAGLGLATTGLVVGLGLYAVWVGSWQAALAPRGRPVK